MELDICTHLGTATHHLGNQITHRLERPAQIHLQPQYLTIIYHTQQQSILVSTILAFKAYFRQVDGNTHLHQFKIEPQNQTIDQFPSSNMSISFEYFSHKLPLPFFHIALVYKLNNRWRCTCKPNNLNELTTTIPYPKNNSYLVYSLSRSYLKNHSKLLTNLLQSTFNHLHSNNFLKNSTSISNLMVHQNPSLIKQY